MSDGILDLIRAPCLHTAAMGYSDGTIEVMGRAGLNFRGPIGAHKDLSVICKFFGPKHSADPQSSMPHWQQVDDHSVEFTILPAPRVPRARAFA